MQAVKRYLGWIVIGAIIVGALAFYYIHVGALKNQAYKDHERIANQVRGFKMQLERMPKEVPTSQDLEFGDDFLSKILEEGRRSRALWRSYADSLEEGISNGVVVYPVAAGKERAGKPVMPQFFPDFLRSNYLKVMADAQNNLADNMQGAWVKMLAQSFYATNYKLDKEQAEEQAKSSAKAVALKEAKIFAPGSMIPFKMTEDFSSVQKRVESWRQFLIFRDILMRVVSKSSADVKRQVLMFERPGPDFDPAVGKLDTSLSTEEGARFIEQLSLLQIRKVKTGGGEIRKDNFVPAGVGKESAGGFDPTALLGLDNEKAPEAVKTDVAISTGSSNFFDVYEITIEMTAHLKVVHNFINRFAQTRDLYYVSRSCEIVRLPDSVTMGNYVVPSTGTDSALSTSKILPDAAFAASLATPVDPFTGLEHESPVKVRLVYLLLRPRFNGMTNDVAASVDKPGGLPPM